MFEDPWPADRSWWKSTALFLVPVLVTGLVGYRYLTTATPITSDQALRLFRTEKGFETDRAAARSAAPARNERRDPGPRPDRRQRVSAEPRTRSRSEARSTERVVLDSEPAQSSQKVTRTREREKSRPREPAFTPGAPEEGVYSWDTEGYESFNGSRRTFPRETQRIVTRHSETSWTLHHYFSKERESWTDVNTSNDGYRTTKQRNKIVFGPVSRDVTINFDPAMHTGPMPARVGATWSGEWQGDTYGTYRGRYFEKTKLTIDGDEVEVWGIEYQIRLRGETEGTTWAQVWISPQTHMVVKEHYKQDVQSGPGTYRAEWMMTVRSLTPRR